MNALSIIIYHLNGTPKRMPLKVSDFIFYIAFLLQCYTRFMLK